MPLIHLALPLSPATRKRILHDYPIEPIVLKRGTWLYDMVSRTAVPLEASKEGTHFQYHTNRYGTVTPYETAVQLDRHYTQLRNETLATHIRLSQDMVIVNHALLRYNELFGIETDVNIALETMQKAWTRWCQAKRERKTAPRSHFSTDGVHPECERGAVTDYQLDLCVAEFLEKYRRKFIQSHHWDGVNIERVFELCAYVYRFVGGCTTTEMAIQFQKDRTTCHKAAERFKYRLIEWQKQGIEPPQLIQSPNPQ